VVSRRAVTSRNKVGKGVVAATASGKQQLGSNTCYRGGPHKVKDCTTKRMAPSARGLRRSGCFRCGSIEHYISSCECAGFSGWRCRPGWRAFFDENRVGWAYRKWQLSPQKELLSSACVQGGRLDLSKGAGIKLTSGRMPVVQAILNGRCVQCLVDTRSEQTLVSPRVVMGQGLWPGRPLLTADGSVSYVSGTSRIVVGLQEHNFSFAGPVMRKLGNFGVAWGRRNRSYWRCHSEKVT